MYPTDLEIIVGTYEEFLLGYKIVKKANDKLRLLQSFADHSHRASIRSICAEGKFLATGSADETINLYDMKIRKQTGTLGQHAGTVTCLSFSPNGSHLLSTSEDGSISIFRTGSWQVEKVFPKAHKGEAVTCLSIHPSGKLAMSVGTDATLRTWNLVKGRQAYATNLGKGRTSNGRAVSCLQWSPGGTLYVIAIGTEVNVYDVSAASVIYTIQLKKKVTAICFAQETKLVVGDEGGELSFYSIPKKKQLSTLNAHKHRVKCVNCINVDEEKFLVSTSSGGEIKVWQYKDSSMTEICCANCDCRITCLVVLNGLNSKHNTMEYIKEEVQEKVTHNISISEEGTKSKRTRKDSEESSDKRTLHNKVKKRKSKLLKVSNKSVNTNVVCTKGQKWIVEDI